MNPISSGKNLNYLVGISNNASESESPFRAKPTRSISYEKIHYVTDKEERDATTDAVKEMTLICTQFEKSNGTNPYDRPEPFSTEKQDNSQNKESLHGVISSSSSSDGEESTLRFKKRLARGGFGAVWLAKMKKEDSSDKSLSSSPKSKKVAVKEFFEFDDRELVIVEDLIHRKPAGVPRLYGIMNGSHLVMKFCNHGTAAEYLSNVEDPKRGFRKLEAILSSIDAFHHAGYCHRDIHEGNIMLHHSKTGKETIYLTDFGHAGNIKKQKGDIHPIGSRPMFFRNSPVKINQLFENGKDDGDYSAYNNYLKKNGQKIDLYQAGMMIFRFATAQGQPIIEGGRNEKQKALIRYLSKIQEEDSSSLSKLRSQTNSYLKSHHSEIDKEIRKVITKLLFPSSKTSLKNICNTIHSYSKTA